ncbi:unnamed protein product [Cercopithifilaria johnstoni]|uniref:Uncharacterized protein n=1 Tax=Cercopithifilaria johnstoni TaxID=2874296 RepID=A0A8J2LY53_9BILA|nr:unnamed protein product [Cercopithifilaria johnstoni]
MASKYNVCDDANNVSWPLIKYTKLVGTRLEIPVTPGQAMVIIYNKNRCYLSVMFNSSTLEEFSLALNPRPTMRSKEKDIFIQVSSANGTTLTRFRVKFATVSDHASFVEFISFFVKVLPPSNMNTSSDFSQPLSQGHTEMRSSQGSSQFSLFSNDSSSQKSLSVTTVLPSELVSDFYPMQNSTIHTSLSACLVGEKVYEVLKPVKYPEVRHYSESFETVAPSFSQNSGERMLNCLETSKTADQTVPFSTSDMEMAATQPNVNLPLAAHFNAVSSKNYVQQNRQSVGVQTEKCLSVSDLLNDSSRLEEYLKEKLQDHQFMQLVEKCSQIYHTVFRTAEASSHVSSIEPIIPAKTRRRFKKTK